MIKSLEALENIKECLFWSDKGLKDIATIEKELKALEIIKECGIKNALSILKVETKNGCEPRFYCLHKRISKDKYYLLKEVLQ